MSDRSSPPERSAAAVQAELADVERYLRETPPHSGSGVRAQLEARRQALQRELAAARRPR
ncbi:hypothetical protein FTX61_01970 [Nitriliruptoraceae bacterium ZYF776]|nr:hypothetical protein [Profundirhabdus halotolerans]